MDRQVGPSAELSELLELKKIRTDCVIYNKSDGSSPFHLVQKVAARHLRMISKELHALHNEKLEDLGGDSTPRLAIAVVRE
jgi:hypothetical protein